MTQFGAQFGGDRFYDCGKMWQLVISVLCVAAIAEGINIDCSTQHDGSRFPVPNSCEEFYECSNGKLVKRYCLQNQQYDVASMSCVDAAKIVDDDGFYVIYSEDSGSSGSCARYHVCVQGAQKAFECPAYTYFDINSISCVTPSSSSCRIDSVVCGVRREHLPNPRSLASFYKCVEGFPHLVECETGHQFVNGRCVADFVANMRDLRTDDTDDTDDTTEDTEEPETTTEAGETTTDVTTESTTAEITSTTEEITSTTEAITSTTEEITSTTEEITSTTEEITSTTEEITSTTEEITSTTEEITGSTTEEITSTTEEITSTTEEITSTTEEITSTTEEITSTTEEITGSTTEEITSTTEEITSTTEEITGSTTEEITSTTEEITSTTEEITGSTTEEITSTTEEITGSTTEEITSTTEEITSTTEGITESTTDETTSTAVEITTTEPIIPTTPTVDPSEVCAGILIGVLPYPGVCHLYIVCVFNNGLIRTCEAGYIFSRSGAVCVPGNWETCEATRGFRRLVSRLFKS
ncbi:uncharacterized protein LOC129722719 [Wyeomyia smithii]|uniref:uncharacterized protein LOC129722719 n=1 Tax=Wyeomyia smithii TaxID=174621 RepID=UPI002467D4AF|nr:uncharacterized protein LOC129722719 [Wyeomyia smithii]